MFAMWLLAAHRATMRTDYRAALVADPDGFAVAPASLPGAPAGLPVPAGLTLGVMPDGSSPAPGVPMAWAVLTLAGDARSAARAGAFGAGLVDVGIGGSGGGRMAVHETAIGAARGAAVPAGALFATADLALSYEEEALYRRAQPGRPWASRMEADLLLEDGGGVRRDIDGARDVDGIRGKTLADVSSDATARVAGDAVGANWSAGQEAAAPCVASASDPCLAAGAVDVTGDAANPGNLTATGAFAAGSGRFAGELGRRHRAGGRRADRRGLVLDAGVRGRVAPRRGRRARRRDRAPVRDTHGGGTSEGGRSSRHLVDGRRDACGGGFRCIGGGGAGDRRERRHLRSVGADRGNPDRIAGRVRRMLKRRRCRAGMSLFGTMLALVVFGVFVAAGFEWLEQRARERVVKMAGAQAVALSDAVGSWVEGSFEARLAAAPEEVALATVRNAGVLAPGFAPNGSDAMGRRFRILTRVSSPGVLDVLVTHDVGAGDRWFPSGAVLGVRGDARIGVVPPGVTPAELRGPALRMPVAGFRADHGGAPAVRAIGVLMRHDRQSVYGDYLYRGAVAGLPEANRMETDLDMDGHDVTGVGDLEADTMTLEGDLDVGGGLRVTADLLIGGSGRVEGIADGGRRAEYGQRHRCRRHNGGVGQLYR